MSKIMHSFPVNLNSVSTKANFRCDMYPGSIGFPTRRKKERGNYIASNNSTMWFKCPEKCRRQPEWTYCWARIWISLCTFFFKSRRLVCKQCKTEDWKPHWKMIFQKHQDSILANIIIWNNHKVVCMLFFFAEVKTLSWPPGSVCQRVQSDLTALLLTVFVALPHFMLWSDHDVNPSN